MKLTILLLIFSVQKLWALPLQGFDDDVFLGHEKEFDSSLEAGIEKYLKKITPILNFDHSYLSFVPLVGQGVDAGPSDVGHELHAKMEEAAEKALAIIEHAGKYLDDATKEQSKKEAMSISVNDKDTKSPWEREKRQVFPVPQTDSDAAKRTVTQI